MTRSLDDTTAFLNRWSNGCRESGDELLRRLYPELRRLARRHRLSLATPDGTSDMAQELCLRLFRQRSAGWRNRGHFFAIAAKLMRRISVDSDRRARALKRGGDLERIPLEECEEPAAAVDVDLIALDEALTTLATFCPLAVRIVELRFFAGLGVDETAQLLEVSRATVLRRWRFARAWLHDTLDPCSRGGCSG